ncbi:MAG: SDR family NAD(P)-dependent oxidoreductase, partial [Cypionkella sp.]|nr:SDR family NAD(P)-dependent oxidoreductase [Cypionkella sp.]
MNRMDGKICVVTGATQGLGAAIARRLAAAGAAGIVIMGRNAAKGQAVADGLPCPALFVQADFGSIADCQRVIAEADA